MPQNRWWHMLLATRSLHLKLIHNFCLVQHPPFHISILPSCPFISQPSLIPSPILTSFITPSPPTLSPFPFPHPLPLSDFFHHYLGLCPSPPILPNFPSSTSPPPLPSPLTTSIRGCPPESALRPHLHSAATNFSCGRRRIKARGISAPPPGPSHEDAEAGSGLRKSDNASCELLAGGWPGI